jgi:lysophospholipase L1-like esterase
MRGKKALTVVCLLLACFLLYFILPDVNRTAKVSLDPTPLVKNEQTENLSGEITTDEEEQQEEDTNRDKPVTEEIKQKVREVVEGALSLFKKDQTIVAIGDSLTQGVGDETDSGGYVGILNNTFEDQHMNIKIENYGKRGNRSDQLLKRLDKEEIASSLKEADIVLITIGANDIMNVVKNNFTNLTMEPFQEEKMEYMDRLRSIFTKVLDLNPDAQIYLIGFYNPFERYFSDIEQLGMIMENWNDAGQSVTEEFDQAYFIPTADLFKDSQLELLAEDFFHPNTSGYKLMAERVLDYLKEYSKGTELTTETTD